MRKVKFKRTGAGDDAGSENVDNPAGTNNNSNEETKVAKSGNKRGRPRKNPIVPKEEGSSQKLKRGRKPKKLYDIDPNNEVGINMTFNDSENKDNASEYSDHPINHNHHESSPMGIIERNLKIADRNTFSFDSVANFTKNDNYNSNNLPFIPRKQSLTNPFDKF